MAPLSPDPALAARVALLERDLAEALAAKETAQDRLRFLAAELTHAEQRERRRLGQLLHDHLQQLLVAAKLRASLLDLSTDEKARETAAQVERILAECIAASRALAAELSPPLLDDAGLGAALEWLARQMRESHRLEVMVEGDLSLNPGAADVRTLLFQSTREQLFNVVKHAGVRAAQVFLTRAGADRVAVEIRDAGRGFEVEASLAQGSGLRHIRQRLELLGGRMELESAPGRGTRVVMVAPLDEARRPAIAPRAPAAGARRTTSAEAPRRVLLVDDNDLVRRGLAELLGRLEALELVGEAEDGQAALERALELEPDVVLMDVTMPRLDGIEATRLLKQLLPELRIVGLSLRSEPEVEARMRQAGASAFVAKDEGAEALLAAILGPIPT
jgi:CheY-like chemotaxis protein